jgi:hypothetical protein
MTAIPQSAFNGELSDRLIAPLRQVARRGWIADAAVAVCKTLILALLCLLAAALVLGYFQSLWMPVRIVLSLLAWAGVIYSAIRFLRPVLVRRGLAHAAMHVERDQPELHERLSSAVSLGSSADGSFRGSPSLLAHLFHQAESDADAVKPDQVVPFDRVIRWAILVAPVIVCWMTLALVPATAHTTLEGLYRVLMPWKQSLPAMLTQVLVKPGDVTLVQGDAMDITAHVSFAAGRGSENHAVLMRKFENGQTLTDAMDAAGGPRDFTVHLADLQQTFSYRVSTDQGDSPWFTATVHPRPQIGDLEIRCDYPAYTGLAATVTTGRDGAIHAIVGTRVTVTVHTALPVIVGKSQIDLAIDGRTGAQNSMPPLPLTQADEKKPEYQAGFVVKTSGQYRVNLTNEFGLSNSDDQPHTITAIADEVPTIFILSPDQKVTVGADETVPVKYIAKDDFGVAKIEAIFQVGEGAPQTVPVNFTTADKRVVKGSPLSISVADLLKTAANGRSETITYQLKVTDNRDPDPQVGFSNKQILKVDLNGSEDFQAREEKKLAADLTQAIERAIRELNLAQMHIQPARDFDAHQSLDDWRRKQLSEGAVELPGTSKALASAAEDAKGSAFDAIAAQVKDIADKQITPAADDAAQADLNADKGVERHDAAVRSVAEITQARDQLQKLLASQAIDKTLHQAEAARDLADAAKKQQEAADLMKTPQQLAEQPHDHQAQEQQRQAMHEQELANQKLNAAMNQSEALRDQPAQETARELQDLIHKVDEVQKQQDAAAQHTEKQKAAAAIQQDTNAVAQQQQALNQEIAKSVEQNKQALKQANANPPSKDQQQNIVKALDRNQIADARNQMDQSAAQLRREQAQLENLAQSKELHPTDEQQEAISKDQQAQEQAQKANDAAKDAANALKQAQKENDPADARAEHAAEKIEKQAEEMHPQDAQAKQDAATADQHAKAAEQAADHAAHADTPAEAQKDRAEAAAELQQAAKALNDAAKENAQADKATMAAAQHKAAAAAADQTAHQAEKQEELARTVKDQQRELAKVQNPPPADQAEQQERRVAEQTRDAKKNAEQLEQQAQRRNDPDVQARAKHAEMHLAEAQEHEDKAAAAQQQAAKHQQEAADAHDAAQAQTAEKNAEHDLDQAQQQEQQAQAALAKAAGQLHNASGQQANAQGKPTEAQQAAQAAQEAAQAQRDASQQNPAAAQQAARALSRAAQAMAKATQPGQGEAPGPQANGQQAKQPTPGKGRSDDPKEGASILAGLPLSLPASVLDMGISADQWAMLPPLVKKDLINAAQQSGPPAYRQMMREYFAKVAKMQEASGQ